MRKAYTPKTPYTPRTPYRQKSDNNDALQVYCRLKPLSTSESSCVQVISDTIAQLNVPDSLNTRLVSKQYTFQKIFTENNSQKEIFDDVALPLVEKLISGKSSLLFTYGVTGSGKTYTMTGNKQNVGIMPRCLDVLFNSVSDFQAQKFIFKPDKMNGFEVQTEEEAERDREDYLRKNNAAGKLKKKDSQEDLLSARSKDGAKVDSVQEDNAYGVFITYIEIYNNYVYDLLDNFYETNPISKPQSKLVREDGSGNMYIHGITEVEVKSTEEAFEVFYKGQKRKRMAQTTLNSDSSRSHSIFTIRLVQAPLDIEGETVLQDKHTICISHLSLVDLAGSERTNRTKNTGQRLNEASKINQSLMGLRKCFELLRENQQTNSNKMVPYREQKLTLLFKNFFEGDGDIRMVVCVNPSTTDADENLLVMQFAETSQDIITKPTPLKTDFGIGLTPGRRRANMHKKTQQMLQDIEEQTPASFVPNIEKENNLNDINHVEYDSVARVPVNRDLPARNFTRPRILDLPTSHIPNDASIIYNFPPFPQPVENADAYANSMKEYLEQRIPKTDMYKTDLNIRSASFREKLIRFQENYLIAKREVDALKAQLECDFTKTKALEKRLLTENSGSDSLKKKLEELTAENRTLKNESNSLKRKCDEYSEELKRLKKRPKTTDDSLRDNVGPLIKKRTVAVSNPRHNRTVCDSRDKWLDHRPVQPTPLNTVLQPVMPNSKSFDKVTSPKDVRKMSKYCLINQNQDETGDVETQLYKGDIIPTSGGGAQVIYNDVETLKQTSPLNSPTSPKPPTPLYPDIEAKCSVALEGHSMNRKR